MKPIVIGVAGGTGSGKTTVVEQILSALGPHQVAVIQHDSYYRDRADLPPAERARINYDHPDALETELLVLHLRWLCEGHPVDVPVYDFANHIRSTSTRRVEPRSVILIEGILVLGEAALRQLMDVKVYVETDDDIRFIRRLKRDLEERGRSLSSVIDQYVNTVKPMHLQFVEPSKRAADIIIPEGGYNDVAVDLLISKIRRDIG